MSNLQAAPTPCWGLETDKVENWAYIENVFTSEECNKIIETCKQFQLKQGTIYDETFQTEKPEYRKSNVVFVHPYADTAWIYQRLTDAVKHVNQYFNFELTMFAENLQFTEYVAPSGNYDWHIDKTYNSTIRKLSIIVQLTEETEYEGGDFQVSLSRDPDILKRKQGTMLAIPSYVLHKVTPVTRGTRYSLVAWITGPQFK